MRLKALVLEAVGRLEYREVLVPDIQKNEVLVRVKNCGICGSDIPRAYRDGAHVMPLITGHEFSGEVVKPGSKELHGWTGKRVGIFPLIPCMSCPQCLRGQYEMCRSYSYLGSRRDGGFAEYVAVPEWNLLELPLQADFEQAAMLEPMAVAAHAIRRTGLLDAGETRSSDNIAVYGAGTIGLFILMMLIAQGDENVFVFGNHDIQKKKAVELGLREDCFCDIRREDAKEWALNKTKGEGFACSFEAVGNSLTYEQAIELSAPAGRVCLVGNPSSDMGLKREIYWKILRNQLTVFGTWNSSFKGTERDDWEYAAGLLKEKRIRPETVITHRFSLKELKKGFLIMRDKTEEYIKIMGTI